MSKDSLSILIADDSSTVRASLAVALARMGHEPIVVDGGLAAIRTYLKNKPDLALIAVDMPDADGYEVARAIRESDQGEWVPIVFLSGVGDEENLERGIEAGGDDYLAKPVSQVMLAAKLRALQRVTALRHRLVSMSGELLAANRQIEHLNVEDSLTKLPNRRGFDQRLAHEIARARRSREPLSIALIEIDFFNRYAEYFGAQQGDECVRQVGAALKATTRRAADFVARVDPDRFALVLPNTHAYGALSFGGMLVHAIDQLLLNHPKSEAGTAVTISCGIATCVPEDSTNNETMFQRVEEAMFAAVEQGRHRVFSFDATATPSSDGLIVKTLHLPRAGAAAADAPTVDRRVPPPITRNLIP